jgi:type IV pilus assembly protein PilZ
LTHAPSTGYDADVGPKAKGDVVAELDRKPGSAGGGAEVDRRRAPRVLVDLEVDYASEDNYLFAYVTDISDTGIFVRTTTPEEPGTHLNLRFAAATGEAPIECEGEVIWVNPYRPGAPDNLHPGMGIRFVGLDDELRQRLVELIRRFAYLS